MLKWFINQLNQSKITRSKVSLQLFKLSKIAYTVYHKRESRYLLC